MGPHIKAGRILGIPICISYTWFIVLVIILLLLSQEFSSLHPAWSPYETWVVTGVTSILFFASILVHELSHSIVAQNMGIPVKRITLFVFGGISEISSETRHPSIEFLIAIVGPISSILLGILFIILFFYLRNISEHSTAIAQSLAVINISLAVFNLWPLKFQQQYITSATFALGQQCRLKLCRRQ